MPFSPAFALSLVLASLYAVLFHLFWGKRLRELPLYLLAALIGFGLGQALAGILSTQFLMIGDVHLLEGSVACWLLLLVARQFWV